MDHVFTTVRKKKYLLKRNRKAKYAHFDVKHKNKTDAVSVVYCFIFLKCQSELDLDSSVTPVCMHTNT